MTIRRTADPQEVRQWASAAARAADEKNGVDTVVLEVGEVLAITDAFVITAASNTRQVRTIADEVEAQVKRIGGPSPLRIEGLDDLRWVVIDYGDFVVHVLLAEVREFYDLERLWSDAGRIDWQEVAASLPTAAGG